MKARKLSSGFNLIIATVLFTFLIIGCSEKVYQKKAINNFKGGVVGIGQASRKVIFRDKSMITNATSKSGTIVMSVCIDREGNVSKVGLIENESSIEDTETLKNALSALGNYKYEADPNAPEEECGRFKVSVDIGTGK